MSGPVRSVSQAFGILRLIAARPRGMTLSDVARSAELSPSSCLNLLRTLVSEGALERSPEDRRYRIVQEWSPIAPPRGRIERFIERSRPLLRQFADAHDCLAGLWQVVGPERFSLVAMGETEAQTRIHMVVGQRQPIGSGSIGRALAAAENVSPQVLRSRYAQVRWQQALSFETYAAQVARAARVGFAIDDGFGHAGICSLGAVVSGQDSPRFCITASIFARSRDTTAVEELGQALANLARDPAFGS